MRLFVPLLAALLLLPSLVMAAPKLWGEVEPGMSPGDVLRLYPAAKDGTRDTIGQDQAVELLRIPSHMYQGDPFTVRFFFKGKSLHLVMLTHEASSRTSLETLPDWTAPFTAEYGEPRVRDSHPALDKPGIVYRQYIWQGDDRDVVIVWARAGQGEPIMNINFTAP